MAQSFGPDIDPAGVKIGGGYVGLMTSDNANCVFRTSGNVVFFHNPHTPYIGHRRLASSVEGNELHLANRRDRPLTNC